jgi:acyl-CoA synthetase (AMP-forming)/AMP-acid ligase II
VTDGTLRDLLAIGEADAPALVEPTGRTVTHGQLRDGIDAVAGQLSSLGVGTGDRVALVMANGADIVITFLAVTSLGAAAAPLNPALSEDEMHTEMADLAVSLALFDEASLGPASGAAGRLDRAARLVTHADARIDIADATPGGPASVGKPDDVALLLHTSGTTSKPKTVPLAQRNLAASVRTVAATYKMTADDIGYVVMPLFHVHGLVAGVLAPLSVGARVVVPPKFSASSFWSDIHAHRATWYTAVPTIHHLVVEAAGDGRQEGHGLRFVRSCSSTLPAPLMRRFEELVGVPLVEAYGMTEASHQMTSNPLPPARREPGSVGLPTGIEVQVVDESWAPVPTGEPGEVCVRGRSVVDGYLDNPDANATSFRDGWFRTGDVGTLDADGYLRLVGRIKELINRGGEKISPYEVEAVLLEHPMVSEAAVYPKPDDVYGEQVAAVVVPSAAVDSSELIRHCRERMVAFKVPVEIAVLDAIPKGPTGKIQRRLLASLVAP